MGLKNLLGKFGEKACVCRDCGKTTMVSLKDPKCRKCGSRNLDPKKRPV